jgi:hypothetical protein
MPRPNRKANSQSPDFGTRRATALLSVADAQVPCFQEAR